MRLTYNQRTIAYRERSVSSVWIATTLVNQSSKWR